jgi:hypothetical protein
VSNFDFHPELFERRTLALETLAENGYVWLEGFTSVDLLHDLFGLEVCGIAKRNDAEIILSILEGLFPEWPYSDLHYHDYERDRGWKAMVFKNVKQRTSFTTA